MPPSRAPHRAQDRRVLTPGPSAADPRAVLYKPSVPPSSPWIFRKMIAAPREGVPNGSYLELVDRAGQRVGRGILNRRSEVAFRLLGGPDAPESFEELLDLRLADAVGLRVRTLRLPARTDAWRAVNSEGDRLSGLVVDRYGATCVVSVFSQGYVAHAEAVEAALRRIEGVTRVLFRSDDRTEKLEGFRLPPLPDGLHETVREGRVKYRVDLSHGHKTGLFLDQRENRALVASLAEGRRVLDLGTNAGGFALAAAVEGRARRVTAVDLDEVALGCADRNARLNRVQVDFVHGDLFPFLRDRIEAGERDDVVVLDPPKLARDRREIAQGLAVYREMNTLAFGVVAPGGLLLTCSCSGAVSEEDFLETLRRAARAAGRPARVIEVRGAAPDHPVALDFPEGRYLKAVLLKVD